MDRPVPYREAMPAVSEAVAAAPPSTVLAARQLAIALVVAAIVHLVLAHAVADVLAALGPGSRAFAATGLMLMAIALPVWFLVCVPLLRAGREAVAAQMQASALLNERLRVHDLDVRLAAALEMAEDEDAVLRIARQALAVAADGAPAQLLLADTPDGAMRHSLVQGELPEEVRCYIGRPCDCPSVRRGMGTVYEDSMVLSACRGLKGPISAACAAACTPITVAGSGVGMVRALGPAGDPVLYRLLQTLNTAAHHVGARLAVIRSISASERQAATDPLTGAANRRSAESRIAELARSGEAYAMAMVDIDHFKHINDHHGHDVGDQALKLLVGVIRESIRDGDTLCRQGGEEFLLVFPGGDAAFAELVLQRLRSELPRACARARLPVFTFSAGIADGPLARPETMLRAADAALYRAKESGRDRILRSEPGEGEAATA